MNVKQLHVTMDTNDLQKVKAEVVDVDSNTSICRCCLATDRRLAKLKDFCCLLLDLTGIVSESDDLPKYICWECAALLRKAVRFKQKVLQAHSILCDFNNRCNPSAINAKNPELTQYSPLLLAKTPTLTFCSDSSINETGFHDVLQHKVGNPSDLVPLQDVSEDIKNENLFIQIEVKEERLPTDSDNDLTLHICDGTMNSEDSEDEYLVERKPRERRKVKIKRRDDTTSDSEDSMTPPEMKRTARAVIESLLPEKSKRKYDKAYKDFIEWKSKKNASSFSENVMLTYFSEKAQKYQPSSLWSMYSMLKSTLMAKDNINIVEYKNLTAFLKRKSQGFRGKKTKVLTTDDIYTFLQNAPDDKYLLMKVVLIMGVNGACRTQELTQLTTDHIEVQENVIIVTLPSTKTKIQRSFVLSDLFYEIVKKYTLLRPDDVPTNRFFLQYRESKCVKQVLGKNKICSMPKAIATYLNLQNAEEYTGYCFRKTAAAILPAIRSNINTIKPSGP